ncbi:hypothetical protein [Luteibacter sp. UNCMF366Tsu5.1]|uniref:hypothetical protein n=1 Tax=Luteibacter sp. UNCMF366Tsu5.1 TaxID=1502758 RepID=UPI0009311FC5|nr:hypothetical protein [Luteibacter sp. UNCMF366Tsu5.1]
MTVSTARAILLRHDDALSLDPHALIQPGHVRLSTTLRLEASHVRAPLPSPAGVAWSSVPIEPIVPAALDAEAPDAVASAWDAAHALVIHARAEGGAMRPTLSRICSTHSPPMFRPPRHARQP